MFVSLCRRPDLTLRDILMMFAVEVKAAVWLLHMNIYTKKKNTESRACDSVCVNLILSAPWSLDVVSVCLTCCLKVEVKAWSSARVIFKPLNKVSGRRTFALIWYEGFHLHTREWSGSSAIPTPIASVWFFLWEAFDLNWEKRFITFIISWLNSLNLIFFLLISDTFCPSESCPPPLWNERNLLNEGFDLWEAF